MKKVWELRGEWKNLEEFYLLYMKLKFVSEVFEKNNIKSFYL